MRLMKTILTILFMPVIILLWMFVPIEKGCATDYDKYEDD